MKEIQLSKNGKYKGKYVALVDDEDYEYLNQFNWYVSKDGNTFYAARSVTSYGRHKTIKMHREIMDGEGIDHIDRNGLNNKKSNLRSCSRSENSINSRKRGNTSSSFKGVYFYKRTGKWASYIAINHKRIYIGLFADEIEAAICYDKKAKELHGEFAYLNFPEGLPQSASPVAPVTSTIAATIF